MPAPNDFWFRPKRYGYGAAPANWKGWLATVLYVAVVLSLTWQFIVVPARTSAVSPFSETAWVWGVLLALTLGFVWLCRVKTEGEWHWRWGSDS